MKFLQQWYVYLARGIFAIVLGILLVAGRAQWNTLQYIGMFWLSIGLTSIAWARPSGSRIKWARWSLVAGILGVLAGLIALVRPIATQFIATWVFVALIGVLSILTGLTHIFGGFRTGSEDRTHWSWGSFLVGLVQVVLGVIVVIYPFEPIPPVLWLVSGWCLVTGVLLTLDALRLRARASSDRDGDLA
jgi:uncharacterized membrane protein HdeD (DUF308 family)